jgi:hypothetical protein
VAVTAALEVFSNETITNAPPQHVEMLHVDVVSQVQDGEPFAD